MTDVKCQTGGIREVKEGQGGMRYFAKGLLFNIDIDYYGYLF